MKRARNDEHKDTTEPHIITFMPDDMWPIIFRFCTSKDTYIIDVESYRHGSRDIVFSFACVNKQYRLIAKKAICELYNKMSNQDVSESLRLFPIRSYYVMSELHYSKNNAVEPLDSATVTQTYRKRIHDILIKHVLLSLIDRLFTTRLNIYDDNKHSTIVVSTDFHMTVANKTKFIQYCVCKYRNEEYATEKTICYTKKTLELVVHTPIPIKLSPSLLPLQSHHFVPVEVCFQSVEDVDEQRLHNRLRVSHPAFRKQDFYDFYL